MSPKTPNSSRGWLVRPPGKHWPHCPQPLEPSPLSPPGRADPTSPHSSPGRPYAPSSPPSGGPPHSRCSGWKADHTPLSHAHVSRQPLLAPAGHRLCTLLLCTTLLSTFSGTFITPSLHFLPLLFNSLSPFMASKHIHLSVGYVLAPPSESASQRSLVTSLPWIWVVWGGKKMSWNYMLMVTQLCQSKKTTALYTLTG